MGKKLALVFLLGFFVQLIVSRWTGAQVPTMVPFKAEIPMQFQSNYIWELVRNTPAPGAIMGEANDEGFRDIVNFSDKQKTNCEKFVIALFGASGIYGFHLRFEDTIGVQLEKRLAEIGMPTNVYNFGVPGYTLSQAEAVSEKWIPELKPDLVILNFGSMEMSLCAGRLTDSEYMKLIEFPLLNSDFARTQLFKLNYAHCTFNRDSLIPIEYMRPRVTTEEYFHDILEIKSRTEAASNGEVWIWPFMISHEYVQKASPSTNRLALGTIPFYHEPQQVPFFAENKIKILTELEKIEDPKYYFEDGSHPNPNGVKKTIDVILPDIVKYLKSKKPKTCQSSSS
ncbi:MAG: SGNH/GDSL hydrolase family protein [Pseudobdellovibrio sp.]